jgi:hypothetical protein
VRFRAFPACSRRPALCNSHFGLVLDECSQCARHPLPLRPRRTWPAHRPSFHEGGRTTSTGAAGVPSTGVDGAGRARMVHRLCEACHLLVGRRMRGDGHRYVAVRDDRRLAGLLRALLGGDPTLTLLRAPIAASGRPMAGWRGNGARRRTSGGVLRASLRVGSMIDGVPRESPVARGTPSTSWRPFVLLKRVGGPGLASWERPRRRAVRVSVTEGRASRPRR